MKKFWENYKFSFTLLLGIFVGALIGVVMGEKATALEPIGQIFLNLMFTIVVPMVFVSIASSVGSMLNMKRLGKILGSMVGTFIVTGLFAAAIVLVVVNVLSPAANTNIAMEATEMGEMQSVSDMIVGSLTVDDFTGLLSRKNMLPIIIAAILTGLAVAKCGGEESPFGKLLANMNQVIMKLIEMIMKFAPIGLGAYFANLVGEFGPQLIGDYGRCMAIYYPMCLLYGFIFFPLYAWFAAGKKGVTVMAKKIFKPAITAFATQSSCAALPVNMEACDEIGVPSDISNIVLPLGCTMHMDGSVLSAITKIQKNNDILLDNTAAESKPACGGDNPAEDGLSDRNLLTIADIFDFANTCDTADVCPVLDTQIQYNTQISEEGLLGDYGANIGSTMLKFYGDDVRNRAIAKAAAGSDARMSGCELPVVINSGSGNQGITVSVPVIEYAKALAVPKDRLYRALALSNLIAIHEKTGIGRLSAYCGAVSAGCAAGCGIAYLQGADLKAISHTLVNSLAIVSGIICDGAKPSCAAKIASSVQAGIMGYHMYQNGQQFRGGDGIVTKGVENTIRNVSQLGREGMRETDKEIVKIMLQES